MLEVKILGSSSATPTLERHPSAQLVFAGDTKILIDCGEGTQTQMFRYQIKYNRIDYILISHLHGDHFLGLPGLLSTMSLNGRRRPLQIAGPVALEALINSFLEVSDTQLQFPVEYHITDPSEAAGLFSTDSIEISTFPLKHRVPCTGFLIKEKKDPRKINVPACEACGIPVSYYPILKRGKDYFGTDGALIRNEALTFEASAPTTYAYCSDTIFDESIIRYIFRADLLYHEATFGSEMTERARETWHSTASQAAQIASKSEVRKLIIGHFSARYRNPEPLLTEAKNIFPDTELALEGETFFTAASL